MEKRKAAMFMRGAIRDSVIKGLPIPLKELPAEVLSYSKRFKIAIPAASGQSGTDGRRYDWIEKLLSTPIADVRHRTVNLILAPYMVNVKNLAEDEAVEKIYEYIERCKQVDPDTRVNLSYIRYQCKYAKSRKSKPLSLDKARELLGDVLG